MKIQNITTIKNIRNIAVAAATAMTMIAAAPKANAQEDDDNFRKVRVYHYQNKDWVKLEDYNALEMPLYARKSITESYLQNIQRFQEERAKYLDSIEMINNSDAKRLYEQLKAENDKKRKQLELAEADCQNEIDQISEGEKYYIKQYKMYKKNHASKWLNYLGFGAIGLIAGFLAGLFRSTSKK